MTQIPERSGALTFADYSRILWRWKWLIVVVALGAGLSAFLYSIVQTPEYEATAYLSYTQPVDPTNPLASAGSFGAQDLVLQSAMNVVGTRAIDEAADQILPGSSSDDYEVAAEISGGPSETTSEGGFLAVSARGSDPERAEAVANAYASAVSEWRRAQLLNRVEAALRVIDAEIATYGSAADRRTNEYVILQQQRQSLVLLQKSITPDVQVLAPATVPDEPVAPQPLRSALLGLGLGLLVGLASAFLFDQLGTRVRGRNDIAYTLGLPIIGSLPDVPRRSHARRRPIDLTAAGGAAGEALRLLRINLDYVNATEASTLLVTSASAGEGKTTVACNLAVTMAMTGRRIAVVDGDLRSPRIHEFFNIDNEIGLSSVAAGKAALHTAVQFVAVPAPLRHDFANAESGAPPDEDGQKTGDLVVLTAGPPVSNPGELAASKSIATITLQLLESGMEFVIVDSPALLDYSDATAMSSHVEALLLVVRYDTARRSTLHEVRSVLGALPCAKLGVVLTRTRDRRQRLQQGRVIEPETPQSGVRGTDMVPAKRRFLHMLGQAGAVERQPAPKEDLRARGNGHGNVESDERRQPRAGDHADRRSS